MSARRKTVAGAESPEAGRRPRPRDEAACQGIDRADLPPRYLEACRLAGEGRHETARQAYGRILRRAPKKDARLRGLIQNDLAVLDAIEGKLDEAREGWRRALEVDGDLLLARLNRDLLEAEIGLADGQEELGELKFVPAPGAGAGRGSPLTRSSSADLRPSGTLSPSGRGESAANLGSGSARVSDPAARMTVGLNDLGHLCSARVSDPAVGLTGGLHDPELRSPDRPIRVAILSFLFNWPSTGGGNMHTAGLVEFLMRAGYEVRHFFARFPAWGIGRVADDGLVASEALELDEASWNVGEIQARYRRAVDEFQPDYVAITDAWNMKPLLAAAMRGYPVFLLFQAQECLCPLNNLRLLGIGPIQVEQCPRNQLATPQVCHGCLAERGHHSGSLHQVERSLAGVGTAEYDQKLRRALLEAKAVLALNPLTAAMLEPYARRVCVVPWAIDAGRFPWAIEAESDGEAEGRPTVQAEGGVVRPALNGESTLSRSERQHLLFMAAVAGETIKGFRVAHAACRLLRQNRSDFELIVTSDPDGRIDEFTRSVGWQSQADLPGQYRAADICLVPTIAQDGLSITSVEAMASGVPVIASRIGGVPYTVTDGVTGLLCEPGDPADLAAKIARLLDEPELRHEMGLAGRRRFEADFTWETVIERYWRPLLSRRAASERT